MPTYKRGRSRSSPRQRGAPIWFQEYIDPAALVLDQQQKTNLLSSSVLSPQVLTRATHVRSVGSWSIRATTDDVDLGATFSIYVQSLEAFTAGVAPELQTDRFRYLHTATQRIREGVLLSEGQKWITVSFDIKAKARLRGDLTVVAGFESIGPDAGTIEVAFSFRTLIIVP